MTIPPSNQQPSPAASTSQPASTTDTDFRKAPADVNRIPGSAASMNVTERPKSQHSIATPSSSSSSRAPSSTTLSRKTAIQAMEPFLTTSTTSSSPIQPTDIQLLTKSILSNQERQRIILHYQERLIDTCPSLPDLKESLLYLSASSWGQILEERKLAGKCSYPPCTNASPSAASGLGRQREGKFRIHLRKKQVKSREELELGQAGNTWDELREFFCSKQCWARSEWILRWVLGEKELGFEDRGGGDKGVLGGKWQKLTSQGRGEEVELLEDIERQGGVWFDDSEERGAIDDSPEEEEERKEIVEVERKDAVSAKSNVKQVSNLLGDLTIVERPKNNTATTNTPTSTSTSHPPKPYTTPYDVDVPNSLGHRFHPTNSSSDPDIDPSSPTSLLATSSQRELSHILRYASLATGSRRKTAVLSSAPTSTISPASDNDDAEEDGPTIDAGQAKERERLRRLMDEALDVRRDQRELGLLD